MLWWDSVSGEYQTEGLFSICLVFNKAKKIGELDARCKSLP